MKFEIQASNEAISDILTKTLDLLSAIKISRITENDITIIYIHDIIDEINTLQTAFKDVILKTGT